MREFFAPRRDRPAGRRPRPGVESMERRLLLTVYTVTTSLDVPTTGELTLRDAINLVNLDSQPDTIRFAIGRGAQSIVLGQPLPTIVNQVTIDGASQPGYTATPLIAIDGKDAGKGSSPGLALGPGSDNSVVEALIVVDANGPGIAIQDAGGISLLANDIGIIPAAAGRRAQVAPNDGDGIQVTFSTGDQIGAPGAGNTIGGNTLGGISLARSSSGASIQGNFIGVLDIPDSEIGIGNPNYGNGGDGINLNGSTATTVGGASAGAGNLISSNSGDGVHLVVGSGNLIQGNTIGLSATGERAVGNGMDGMAIDNSPGNTIGGTAAGAGNRISGNVGSGIRVDQRGSTGNLLLGNLIGLDLAGTTTLGNAGPGIAIVGAPLNVIGGSGAGSTNVVQGNGGDGIAIMGAGAANTLIMGDRVLSNSGEGISIVDAPSNAVLLDIIGGNRLDGVAILDASASGNVLMGDFIGTDPFGRQLANLEDGVSVENSARNTIGGTSAGTRNVISDNANNGISLRGPGASGNLVQGDYIGVDPTGKANLGNFLDGVAIINAAGNTIGGTSAGARDVISKNRDGVSIQTLTAPQLGPSAGVLVGGLGDNNLVEGDFLGTDVTGEVGLGNFQDGVVVVDGSGNTIGGAAPGAGNLISDNLTDGVGIGSSGSGVNPTAFDLVRGNIIGLDASGTRALGNAQNGVRLVLAVDVTIGGSVAGSGNLISGNTTGVDVLGVPGGPLGDLIEGNVVGLGGDGKQLAPISPGAPDLGNTSNGITLEQGAERVTIGGTTLAAGNEVSGNGSVGVRFQGASSGDLVEGNRIGVAADGLTARPDNESGVFIAQQSTGITIGGTTPGSANVISGNATGVTITNPGTSGNLVEGNLIGLGLDGSTSVGNLGFGVLLLNGVTGNTIGDASPGARNVISGNGQGVGVVGPGSSGNLVSGNVIGLDAAGDEPRENLQLGVFLNAAGDNTIGGVAFGAGNVVSGNAGVGIEVFGPGSSGNLVAGNVVGLDASGSRSVGPAGDPLGNAGFGIQVQDAPDDTIGGTTPGARNTISGNRQAGVDVAGPGSGDTFIQGNFVGTDATGRVPLGNQADGVLIDNAPVVIVGGYGAPALNVISGNEANGVDIVGQGSVYDEVLGNFIGTDQSGLFPLGNGQSGVLINSAPGVVVGGALAPLRDVIVANAANGVRVTGAGSAGTRVEGDYIGLNATGRVPLGNGNDGVLLDGAVDVTIGGLSPGSADVISANASSGVEFGGPATEGDTLEGNLIGTDSSGLVGLGNSTGVYVNGSPFNVIGGTAPGAGNLISGNATYGVHLFGPQALNNAVQGNRIGTDPSGSSPVANQAGVFLDGARANLISGDVLSGNLSAGAIIEGTGASGNVLVGNLVGINAAGTRVVGPATPQQSGILILDAPGNEVGGPFGRNVLSGNVAGVVISGFNAQGNDVLGNFIGTDASGRVALANQTGIYINGSASNIVGGSTPGSGNLISGNASAGVNIYGTLATGNSVEGNVIGTDITGSVKVPNGTGVFLELASSNTIGGSIPAASNLISGNSVAGVYFFDQAANNLVQGNRIGVTVAGKMLGNDQYGVLLFNAANNTVVMKGPGANLIANSGIGDFREFTGPVSSGSTSTTKVTAKSIVKASHPSGPKRVSPRGSAAASPSTGRT